MHNHIMLTSDKPKDGCINTHAPSDGEEMTHMHVMPRTSMDVSGHFSPTVHFRLNLIF